MLSEVSVSSLIISNIEIPFNNRLVFNGGSLLRSNEHQTPSHNFFLPLTRHFICQVQLSFVKVFCSVISPTFVFHRPEKLAQQGFFAVGAVSLFSPCQDQMNMLNTTGVSPLVLHTCSAGAQALGWPVQGMDILSKSSKGLTSD